MITVRFPNGQAVQYNDATTAKLDGYGIGLYDKSNKQDRLLAIVPLASGCMIEWHHPCRVYDALKSDEETSLQKDVRAIRRQLREIAKHKKGGK
jgi:hypothetical protein